MTEVTVKQNIQINDARPVTKIFNPSDPLFNRFQVIQQTFGRKCRLDLPYQVVERVLVRVAPGSGLDWRGTQDGYSWRQELRGYAQVFGPIPEIGTSSNINDLRFHGDA